MSYFDSFPSSIKYIEGIPNVKMNAPVSGLTPKVGDVGLELEIEAAGLPETPSKTVLKCDITGNYWTTHVDGSLRGESKEYIFTGPVDIRSIDHLVNGLYNAFRNNGTRFNLSNRCSTHVHLNVADWKVNYLTSFIVLWSLLEPALIEWCGIERKKNHFCLGVADTQGTIDVWNTYLGTGRFNSYRGMKYSAMNILRLHDLGSIEIRCGMAPESAEDVIRWTKLLNGIRVFTKDNLENPATIPDMFSYSQATGLLQRICEEAGVLDLYEDICNSCNNINELAFENLREVQKLSLSHPWDKWLPMINAEYIPNPFGDHRSIPPPRGERRPVRLEREFEVDFETEEGDNILPEPGPEPDRPNVREIGLTEFLQTRPVRIGGTLEQWTRNMTTTNTILNNARFNG